MSESKICVFVSLRSNDQEIIFHSFVGKSSIKYANEKEWTVLSPFHHSLLGWGSNIYNLELPWQRTWRGL